MFSLFAIGTLHFDSRSQKSDPSQSVKWQFMEKGDCAISIQVLLPVRFPWAKPALWQRLRKLRFDII
jgi:hypothetical protein